MYYFVCMFIQTREKQEKWALIGRIKKRSQTQTFEQEKYARSYVLPSNRLWSTQSDGLNQVS